MGIFGKMVLFDKIRSHFIVFNEDKKNEQFLVLEKMGTMTTKLNTTSHPTTGYFQRREKYLNKVGNSYHPHSLFIKFKITKRQ